MSKTALLCEMEPEKCQDIAQNVKCNTEIEEMKTIFMGLNIDKVQHFFVSR